MREAPTSLYDFPFFGELEGEGVLSDGQWCLYSTSLVVGGLLAVFGMLCRSWAGFHKWWRQLGMPKIQGKALLQKVLGERKQRRCDTDVKGLFLSFPIVWRFFGDFWASPAIYSS